MMVTRERALELLNFDAETGELRWRIGRPGASKGSLIVSKYSNGYLRVCLDRQEYLAHRLIWLMAHGEWPSQQIDHINGVRNDNRLSNLRLATAGENHQNCAVRSDNKSGYPGVTWFKSAGKWRADIQVAGKQHYLGRFDTPEDAAEAYAKAKAELHTFNPVARAA